MTNLVEYILSLKSSQFNKGIGDASAQVNKLEASLASVRNAAIGFIGAFASVEFLKGSIEMYNESAQASAQLDATLRSTANAANLNREALDAQANALMKVSLFDDDAITKSQSLLATFTNIHDTIYMEAIPAITDMATKMGGDLQGATLQVGKALQDPIQGINALRRVGVNFGEEQKKVIKTLVETNHVAEAQALILKELQTEFGGSAAAAAAAGTGPMTVLKNEFNNVREEIGGMVMALVIDLKPAIEGLITGFQSTVNAIKDAGHWISQNKDMLGELALVIGITTIALNANNIAVGAYALLVGGVTLLTDGWALAQTALNAVLAANPLGLVIVAIGAVVGAIVVAYHKSLEFRAAVNGLWEALKSFGESAMNFFKGIGQTIAGVLTFDPEMISKGVDNISTSLTKTGTKAALAFKAGYDKTIQEDQDESKALILEQKKKDLLKSTPSALKKAGAAKPPATDKLEKATGQKAVTINVSINDLIHDFTIQTTNITESAQKVKEMVTNALLDAINNSQMIPIR